LSGLRYRFRNSGYSKIVFSMRTILCLRCLPLTISLGRTVLSVFVEDKWGEEHQGVRASGCAVWRCVSLIDRGCGRREGQEEGVLLETGALLLLVMENVPRRKRIEVPKKRGSQ